MKERLVIRIEAEAFERSLNAAVTAWRTLGQKFINAYRRLAPLHIPRPGVRTCHGRPGKANRRARRRMRIKGAT